jgi:hypothetical protein
MKDRYLKEFVTASRPLMEAQSLNLFKTPLPVAREYSDRVLEGHLDEMIPDFDMNYADAQRKGRYCKDIPRIMMPVIEPSDINQFESDLAQGNVDIFAPTALTRLKERFPARFSDPGEAAEWITLGQKDGDPNDDKLRAKITRIEADKLKPLQSEIWLTNMIPKIAKFGVPKQGSPVTEATLIVSEDMYIIDGHHRTAQAWIADPSLKMKCLYVPLTIDELLTVARSYGAALGNEPKA